MGQSQIRLRSVWPCVLPKKLKRESLKPVTESRRRIVWANLLSFTESEQRENIHFLEGADPSIIDETTGIPLKQEDMLVKIYVRSNDSEVKDTHILR